MGYTSLRKNYELIEVIKNINRIILQIIDINDNDLISVVLKQIKSQDKDLKRRFASFYSEKKNKVLPSLSKIISDAIFNVDAKLYLDMFENSFKNLDDF